MATTQPRCPNCDTNIRPDGVNGLCPKCLLAAGLEKPSTADTPTLDSSSSTETVKGVGGPAETTFGDYVLLEEIARGGMGVVYKAKQSQLNRTVALKMILSGRFASEHDVLRFRQEAEAAANLDHPGIVPIYEIGEHEGHHFFSMKLIEGGALSEHLTSLRADLRGVVQLIAEVARAVHHAHQRGILHRDLKPANILLDDKGKPLVTDLGLAKELGTDSGVTHTGAIVGTPAYMPPEQAAGEKDVTTAADIYSLGAILYETLTGQPPHVGSSPMDTLMKVMNDAPAPPREVDRKVNATVELICLKCLKRNPTERYTSAGALADDLENWLNGRPVSARAASLTTMVGDAFRSNLKSAIGAAMLGLLAGALLAAGFFSFTFAQVVGRGRQVDVHKLYSSFSPEAIPNLWYADLPGWIAPPGLLMTLFVVVFTGLVVYMTVRPRSGEEATAIGLVAGMMMVVSLYSLYVGFLSTASILGGSAIEGDVELLARASFASTAERSEAHEEFLQLYPALRNVEESERAKLVSGKVMSDASFLIPGAIFIGLLASAVMGLLPCVTCTVGAERIYAKRKTFWRVILPYSEMAVAIALFTILLCCWELMDYLNMHVGGGRPSFAGRCLVYAIPVALAIPGFNAWSWKSRYASYVGIVGTAWLVMYLMSI